MSSRISPRTSTVILRDRSPLATAIVTSAMLRTCAVRFDAIWLTDSVSSFQTPDTPLTCAWPPSLPAVPTSRDTRVTSELNTLICSIIVLTMLAERRNSPCSGRPSTSRSIVRVRSPRATAEIERVMRSVGQSRSSQSVLTEISIAPQAPRRLGPATRSRVWPRLPTRSPTRASSSARRRLLKMMSLSVSASLPAMPSQPPGRRWLKSPSRTACSTRSSSGRRSALPDSGTATVSAPEASRRTVIAGYSPVRLDRLFSASEVCVACTSERRRTAADVPGKLAAPQRAGPAAAAQVAGFQCFAASAVLPPAAAAPNSCRAMAAANSSRSTASVLARITTVVASSTRRNS